METKNLIYFLPGPIFMLIGLVINMVSFSTAHWSKDKVCNVGLWKMCLGLSPLDTDRNCFHFSGRSHLPCKYLYWIQDKKLEFLFLRAQEQSRVKELMSSIQLSSAHTTNCVVPPLPFPLPSLRDHIRGLSTIQSNIINNINCLKLEIFNFQS